MIEKNTAIDILEDIQHSLYSEDWKGNTLRTISMYTKNLEITINPKINKLINKYQKLVKQYGEDSKRSGKMAKKIDEEMKKIYYK